MSTAILVAGIFAAMAAAVTAAIFLMAQLGVFLPDKSEMNPLVLMADSAEKGYDGSALTCSTWKITKGSLMQGHHMAVKVYGQQLTVGESRNRLIVKIFDEDGREVTDTYDLTVISGTLTVHPITIGIKSFGGYKEYDGMPLKNPETSIVSGELLEGHRLVCTTVGERVYVGNSPNTFVAAVVDEAGADVTANYEFSYVYEDLVVTPRLLNISTGSAFKEYDGSALVCDVWSLTAPEQLLEGHTVEVKMGIQLTIPGIIENRPLKVTIYEGDRDVTDCYNISFTLGTLSVSSGS